MLQQAPSPLALSRWVDAFWLYEGAGHAHRVLPDGCMDLLVDLASGEGSIAGPMTRAEVVDLPAGTRLFGVRFRPGAAALLLEEPAHALADQHVAVAEVASRAVAALAEQVAEARTPQARIARVEALLQQATLRRRAFDPRVHHAVMLLEQAHGTLPVREVSEQVGVGERQLERLFRERVGYGPKLFARIARLSHALAQPESLVQAALAAQAGYADESHLLRDCRALTGRTPQALRAERDVGFVQVEAATGA
ncbi:AraC family transcriptional regulator [Aggregicoccus sp. 17bor-14]|uniref:DUF6597 domain-containing transcriptional factor n=1 Tax=Myxococcaceae TaxID=31 RepID=UPI00129CCCB5|nr:MULTISPECIES: DUF6597 domain-containing transcriptional factor [Myxococcaceae]MBF5043571.1 helix-turn-helix domain-containing protein [Simulacricoccus sp. 17bor-14]MRI89330.1 AraC family transcriptional regulator [Aggregicoccus sp. 17bor-14]